jgi:23S rRNA (uracil1939-C5)-methyltransferase
LYVSCEPLTLARDLSDLALRGLGAERLLPFDMIPLSGEIETVAMLRPRAAPPPLVLHRDEEILAVMKPPHDAMSLRSAGKLTAPFAQGVRRLPGAEQATPVHHLEEGASGIAVFALRSSDAGRLSGAVAAAEKHYTALVRGVVREKGSIRRSVRAEGRSEQARTRYARRAVVGGHSLVTARPDEERTDQVTRHLASLGHPVVGDPRFGHAPTNQHFAARHFLDRPFLHLARLGLVLDGRPLVIEAALAPDLVNVLESLRGEGEHSGF